VISNVKSSQALRFLTVGSVTFSCEYAVFYILYVFAQWNLLIANSLSFGVGLTVSFMLNRIWAFKQTNYQRKIHHQAAIYIALAITNLVINNLIVGTLKTLGLDPRLGKIIAIITIAVWNFLIYKYIIFKEESQNA
jgi:putative flippase GtrA